jgi:hypothetical protein
VAGNVLAHLVVNVVGNMAPLNQVLDAAHRRLTSFEGTLSGIRAATTGALAGIAVGGTLAAIGGVVAGLYKGISGATHLVETMAEMGEVFGPEAAIVNAAADEMAAKFGIVKRTFLDGAASIGLMGQAAGYTSKQSAELGVNFAKLADDVSSFYDIPMATALNKIRSGLAGQIRPLRELGVLLSADAVKAGALRLGLVQPTAKGKAPTLTEGQKV